LLWVNPNVAPVRNAEVSVASRQEIFSRSLDVAFRYAPAGSGSGTFEEVYRLAEEPARVDRFYVNHAHNDYLELAVEAGIVGVVLILLFLAWWWRAARRVFIAAWPDAYAVAGSIVSATLLLHSLVDFPLRTAAMSAVFAMSLGLMVTPRREWSQMGQARPARHVVIG
jgi:O-antigen ligase